MWRFLKLAKKSSTFLHAETGSVIDAACLSFYALFTTELSYFDFPLPFGDELRKHLLACFVRYTVNISALFEVDGVEFAPCGADTAAEALVGVNDRCTAAEAACGLLLELLLGEGPAIILELGDIYPVGVLSGSTVVVRLDFVKIEIVLVKRLVLKTVSADCETLTLLYEAVDGDCALLAGGNRVNGKLGSRVDIAADKNVGLCGLIGHSVCFGIALGIGLKLADIECAPIGGLTDGGDDGAALDSACVAHKLGYLALDRLYLNGLMLEYELDALFLCLCDLGGICGHIIFFSAVDDGGVRAQTDCGACNIHCDIAAADDDDLFAELELSALIDHTQEVYAAVNAVGILAGNAELSGFLCADAEVECLIALSAELFECNVLASKKCSTVRRLLKKLCTSSAFYNLPAQKKKF